MQLSQSPLHALAADLCCYLILQCLFWRRTCAAVLVSCACSGGGLVQLSQSACSGGGLVQLSWSLHALTADLCSCPGLLCMLWWQTCAAIPVSYFCSGGRPVLLSQSPLPALVADLCCFPCLLYLLWRQTCAAIPVSYTCSGGRLVLLSLSPLPALAADLCCYPSFICLFWPGF